MAHLSKRDILLASLAAPAAGAVRRRPAAETPTDLPAIAPGPFSPSTASLARFQTADWFRNAKFGIWAHWGPQAVPRQGDWYARFMYVPGTPFYDHHLRTYGHPADVGYKDLIPLWKAERFDPDALMARYKAAGARYFVSMGVHHDNFDLWASRHHRWNALAMGPRRDIVGAWKAAAVRQGLRFGVSEHLGASYCWWYPNHLYDQFFPRLGVNYDGADPRFADLYHDNRDEPFLNTPQSWYTRNPAYHQLWFRRIRDLVDMHQPDFLYSDGGLPFDGVGRALLAHFYNASVARSGRLEAIYTCKDTGSGAFDARWAVQDVERGVLKGINPLPWQTDTSNGDWFEREGDTYKTPGEVITMLADIVSKNGNLLLNVVLHADGSLPPESDALLEALAGWMAVNGEAIHDTRPWRVFGEGPTETASGMFKEKAAYTAADIRFTVRDETLYALTLGSPRGQIAIAALAAGNAQERRPVRSVRLLGYPEPLRYRQTDAALLIDCPARLPTAYASAFAIRFA
ncbi:alpha-L-fucosidase [Sphingomonas morindae]|uniref:alpha-L-fucosidase n=1 Tax=Sphingomonas morindae TaxID=1541170 RepID=A0ABY4XD82_9SPHN|nr:alpha-L-fucosidase [Sphingomonas morindae]USI74862.1 alpha-L-fucosidase [Sphingomonas morindae]